MNLNNKYIQDIINYNQIHMLTGFKTKEKIQNNLIDDSIASFSKIDIKNKSILDIGTGCGIPGIPLKLKDRSISLTLLEVKEKRIKFLKKINKYIDFDLITTRAEDAWANYKEKFDIATTRAFGHSSICLEIASQYLKVGGILVLIKGANVDKELNVAKKAATILNFDLEENYSLEDSVLNTKILIFKKKKETNDKYPRKFNLIKQRMLGE